MAGLGAFPRFSKALEQQQLQQRQDQLLAQQRRQKLEDMAMGVGIDPTAVPNVTDPQQLLGDVKPVKLESQIADVKSTQLKQKQNQIALNQGLAMMKIDKGAGIAFLKKNLSGSGFDFDKISTDPDGVKELEEIDRLKKAGKVEEARQLTLKTKLKYSDKPHVQDTFNKFYESIDESPSPIMTKLITDVAAIKADDKLTDQDKVTALGEVTAAASLEANEDDLRRIEMFNRAHIDFITGRAKKSSIKTKDATRAIAPGKLPGNLTADEQKAVDAYIKLKEVVTNASDGTIKELSLEKSMIEKAKDVLLRLKTDPEFRGEFGVATARWKQLISPIVGNKGSEEAKKEIKSFLDLVYLKSGKAITPEEMRKVQDAFLPALEAHPNNAEAALEFLIKELGRNLAFKIRGLNEAGKLTNVLDIAPILGRDIAAMSHAREDDVTPPAASGAQPTTARPRIKFSLTKDKSGNIIRK